MLSPLHELSVVWQVIRFSITDCMHVIKWSQVQLIFRVETYLSDSTFVSEKVTVSN